MNSGSFPNQLVRACANAIFSPPRHEDTKKRPSFEKGLELSSVEGEQLLVLTDRLKARRGTKV